MHDNSRRGIAAAILGMGVLGASAAAQVFTHDVGTSGSPGTAVNLAPDVQDLFSTNCAAMNFLAADGAIDLGLAAGDNIDALDDGSRIAEPDSQYQGTFVFSVLGSSAGQPLTDVFFQSPSNGADLYELALPGHALFKDEVPFGLATNGIESIDGVMSLDTVGPVGLIGQRVYFSLTPGSPTLTTNGWSAADVLTVVVGFPGTLARAISASSLGLAPNDNLDALVLLEINDADGDSTLDGPIDTMYAYFSVDAGSSGLPGTDIANQSTIGNGAEGDIYSSGGAGTHFLLYDAVGDILLTGADEMDALEADLYSGGGIIPPPPEKPPFCPYPGVRIPNGGFWVNICDMQLPDTVNVSISVKICNPDGTSQEIVQVARLVGLGGANGALKAAVMAGQLRAMSIVKPDGTVVPVFAGIQIRPPVGQPGNIVAQVCANISQGMIDCGYNIDAICISMSNWTATIIPIPLDEDDDPFRRKYELFLPEPPSDDGIFGITFGEPDIVAPVVERIETPFLSGESVIAIFTRIRDQINMQGGIASIGPDNQLVIDQLGTEPAPDPDGIEGPYIFEAGALDNPLPVTIAAFGVDPVPITHPLGIDRWATVDGTGSVDFGAGPGQIEIPPDFFGPGSEPFFGQVQLAGDPVGPGNSDTIVERLDDFRLPSTGDTDTVEIQIVELSLRSAQPIMVITDAGPELWDIGIDLQAPTPSPADTMFVMRDGTDFGGFDLGLPVQPVFVFTNVDQPSQQQVLPVQGDLMIGGQWSETPVPDGVSEGPNWYGQSAQLQFVLAGGFAPALQAQLEPATQAPACAADFNGDGVASFPDVGLFLAAFAAGDPSADLTGDGSVTFPDVGAFLAAFTAGCP